VTIFLCIICFILGIVLGRIYGWMKYHYPEFQEAVKLKSAKLRAERARYEAEQFRHEGEIDDEIERRKKAIGSGPGRAW
jgi:hypothetical protein